MGNTTENFGMKAQFIPLGIVFGSCRNLVNKFGFICFEKGEIYIQLAKCVHRSYSYLRQLFIDGGAIILENEQKPC